MVNNESIQSDLFKQDDEGKVIEVGGKELKPFRDPEFIEFLNSDIQKDSLKIFPHERDLIIDTQFDWEEEHKKIPENEDEKQEIIDAVTKKVLKEKNLHIIFDKLDAADIKTRITRYFGRWEEYLKEVEEKWENEK